MEYNIYKGDDELVHWGVRGMRWGVRRYQNKDGTLTAAGKKKLRAETAKVREQEQVNKNRKATQTKLDRLAARKKAADDEKKALDKNDATKKSKGKKDNPNDVKNAKKAVKDMTNEELANAIVRSRLEDEYRRYNPEPEPKRGFASKFIDDAVKPAAINAGRQILQDSITKLGKNLLKDKVDPDSLEALEATYKRLDAKNKIDKILNPDNHLSEEEKTKRADREYKAEDRAAQKEGYKDAADKAQKEKAAAEQKKQRQREIRSAMNRSAVNFVNRVGDRPVSEVSSGRTTKQIQARLEQEDFDFVNWGRYDLSADRWDDD